MTDIQRQQIENSSNIVSAGYDPATKTMHVEFKSGMLYEYADVSPADWSAFEQTFAGSESTGAHFAKTFRTWPKQKRLTED